MSAFVLQVMESGLVWWSAIETFPLLRWKHTPGSAGFW